MVEGGSVPQKSQEIGDDEKETGQSDEVGRHAHREAFDNNLCIERLEDVFRGERVINARILVVPESRELFLPDVHHDG